MTLLRSEAEVTAAEQRIRAAFEAAQVPKAALATAQLESKTVTIEGCPEPEYNGLYAHDSEHKGWPVLKNDQGRYCYRYTPLDKWYLNNEFTPDSDLCNACIQAKEGPLPVGAHTWWVWVADPGGDSPKQVGRTLTVTLQ